MSDSFQPTESKIASLEIVAEIAREERRTGKRIIWANGCFDLIHVGHVTFLERARSLGDLLIVGVNGDESVRSLKGNDRPLVGVEDRARVVASLASVDYVVVFEEKRTNRCLEAIKPDVYVKGGNYNIDTIDPGERDLILSYGGEIVFVEEVPGKSTSDLLREMQRE